VIIAAATLCSMTSMLTRRCLGLLLLVVVMVVV
jgi:hypothetical protein